MKVSDFIELPIDAEELFEEIFPYTSRAEDRVIINCINHADALADALAVMIVEHSKHQLPNKASLQAALALEAYRIAK